MARALKEMPRKRKLVHNPWNPTTDEVRVWAYDANALAPCQDWDLALCWVQHERAYLELASDESCPKRRYFLAVLYLMVGDAVRTDYRNRPRPIIDSLIARGDAYEHPDIRLWQERSRNLLEDSTLFDYEKWCAGGFARATPW